MADLPLSAEAGVELSSLYWDITHWKTGGAVFPKPVGRTTQHVSPLYDCTYGHHLYEEKPNLLIALYTVL